jgi:hypothetical protein
MTWYHAYVVTTAPDNTRTYFRGGPSGDGPSGGGSGQVGSASGGSTTGAADSQSNSSKSSNSSNSSSPGASVGGSDKHSGPWGNITTESGPYQAGTVDYRPGPSTTVMSDNKPCTGINAKFATTLANIQNAKVPYNPFSQNSNSVAHELLSHAGIAVGKPIVWVPAWNSKIIP